MKMTYKKQADDIHRVGLEGDLDYHASSELRGALNKLAEEKSPKIIISLEKVDYIDSSGIAAFVELAQRLKRSSGKVVFLNLTETVQKVFELAKLHLFFTVAPSEEEALKQVNA